MHAAFTIASKNYLSLAGVLAKSYRDRHPDTHFIIFLCDRADGFDLHQFAGGAEIIELENANIPDTGTFIYRYSIMELNTAVKPFVFRLLFETRGYESITYLDPDIWVHEPLLEVRRLLSQEKTDIVLIPHIRAPYFDQRAPNEVQILQSGTYNLGFIALKNGDTARRLLAWWAEKLFLDCVVDIPRGLFVDQKWIDLVPGFFPSHAILFNPTYNVAYWNLHDRRLGVQGDRYTVNGEVLTFFHFSGYSPFDPSNLSKHQNRHELRDDTVLNALCDEYRRAVFNNGYEVTAGWPFSYETLPNGVRLPLRLVREAVQLALRREMDVPDPLKAPDGFCNFLLSPQRRSVSLFFEGLFRLRPDVLNVFPSARENPADAGFQEWLLGPGQNEESLGDLLRFDANPKQDLVATAFDKLRKGKRDDVFAEYKNMWREKSQFDEFCRWMDTFGVAEMGISPYTGEALQAAYHSVSRILNIYFLRADLQTSYPNLQIPEQTRQFTNWLIDNQRGTHVSDEDVSLFREFAAASRRLIGSMCFLYQHFARPRVPASIFLLTERQKEMPRPPAKNDLVSYLIEGNEISLFDQHRSACEFIRADSIEVDDALVSEEQRERLRSEIAHGSGSEQVNFASFMTTPSGMGESGRSMARLFEAIGVTSRACLLPHHAVEMAVPGTPAMFGWPSASASSSVTVANADTTALAETFLPNHYWRDVNVGYWVWETETLPVRFKRAADPYSEIWTPSNYSASAIRKTVQKDVVVVPHCLDLKGIRDANADRSRFGLPAEKVLFGFIFDPLSVLERKNVRGLLRAFKLAFSKNDAVQLVIKINSSHGRTSFEYKLLKADLDDPRITCVEDVLSRQDTFDFMASLDVYVSLHRSEGFGLTCAEAMALEKPVIASAYSGNLDFMNIENSVLVPTKVIETDRDFGPYPAGTRWGDPDAEYAASAMRRLLDVDLRINLGRRARKSILEQLDPHLIASKMPLRRNALIG
jgi:glycosyltransferase involved in cell wall biosynthesis